MKRQNFNLIEVKRQSNFEGFALFTSNSTGKQTDRHIDSSNDDQTDWN